jgi:hypothetical protein
MSQFRFLSLDGKDVAPEEWLHMWADLYPSQDYAGYEELMARHKSFSGADIERIGKWKDSAKTEVKWKPNVASVAYEIWMQAASELPVCPNDERTADFLDDWSERKYEDRFGNRTVEKRFGLSRATTLLHFLSGGRFPIFDSRVRRAMTRLLGLQVPNTVRWYLDSYCPLLSEIAALCGTKDLRMVDKALFSYGGKKTGEPPTRVLSPS